MLIKSISAYVASFLTLVFVSTRLQAELATFEYLRDRLISNRQAVGNLDVTFDIELKFFRRSNLVHSNLPDFSKVHVITEYAKDGSLVSKLSGDLVPGSANLYLNKDGGLLRYFESAGSAYNQVATTSSPDWTIDPLRCMRNGKNVTVLDVFLDPQFLVISIEKTENGVLRLIGELPSKIHDVRIVWTVEFSNESGLLPLYFRSGVLGGQFAREVRLLEGTVTYKNVGGNGCLFPEHWKRTTFSLDDGLATSEEVGSVTKLSALTSMYRETSNVILPDRTRLIDGVAGAVSVVRADSSRNLSFWNLSWWTGIALALGVCFIVLKLRRR